MSLEPEIICFAKTDGPLTKRIRLDDTGAVKSDGSACVMTTGEAWRTPIKGVGNLGELIGGMGANQAIALGSLRPGLPHRVQIRTRRALNGDPRPDAIARTAQNILFRTGEPGFALIDYDSKGMTPEVAERLDREGGFWPALMTILPALKGIARLRRASTSAGLYRQDTGTRVPGSNGLHVYLGIKDAADSGRFLKTLHERMFLHGYGWFMPGRGGQLLERSIVDRMVGSPERLVFEGPPLLDEPLRQDAEARRPAITEGDWLDTLAGCPPLTVDEKAHLARLRAKARQSLAAEAAKAREQFVEDQAGELAKRTGMSRLAAIATIRSQTNGVLLPDLMLPFDDPDLAGKTVADVLTDPAAFEGETLADPLEGVEYGPCKARIMRREDGTPWIHSFAHGRTVYELKFDAEAINAAMAKVDAGDVITVLTDMLTRAEVDPVEQESLIDFAKERTGIGVRSITRHIKEARKNRQEEQAEADRERRLAERGDPRPLLPVPSAVGEYLPVMDTLNSVLAKSRDRIPPARNMEGNLVCVRLVRIPGTHAFVSANEGSDVSTEAPEQWAIHVMSDTEVEELIERHIEFTDGEHAVHLPPAFVRHYQRRYDGALPFVAAIATLPITSGDGRLICADGLDHERGIVFNVDPKLMKSLPDRLSCDRETVGDALRFLLTEWLCDVETDFAGKCTLVALALTVIERSLLDERPTFFVTAGRRGGGKTTALKMVLGVVTGTAVAAAAWSPNEEERRKALHSHLMSGAAYILWDNINRGTHISCPHIERSCTARDYTDRRLGVSEVVRTSAATIHAFTGNNISPKGDLASRSLQVRIDVNRTDPENRKFKHPNILAWTSLNRSKILCALYTILLGNPELAKPHDAPSKTRFPMWYRLVGSAVEHAAKCHEWMDPDGGELPAWEEMPAKIDFRGLFLSQEASDEDEIELGETLNALAATAASHGAREFRASDVANLLNNFGGTDNAITVRSFLFPTLASDKTVTPKAVSSRLKARLGEPAKYGSETLVLQSSDDLHAKILMFRVDVLG